MIGNSINSKKFNMTPGYRPLHGEYKKTIIIVTGESGIGKSTICNELLSDNLNYISVDVSCIQTDHNIKEILDFVKLHGNQSLYKLHILSPIISDKCSIEFVDYFFEKYIINNENLNIILDGYIFKFKNILDYFIEKCKLHDFRVWKLVRLY